MLRPRFCLVWREVYDWVDPDRLETVGDRGNGGALGHDDAQDRFSPFGSVNRLGPGRHLQAGEASLRYCLPPKPRTGHSGWQWKEVWADFLSVISASCYLLEGLLHRVAAQRDPLTPASAPGAPPHNLWTKSAIAIYTDIRTQKHQGYPQRRIDAVHAWNGEHPEHRECLVRYVV